MIGKKDMRNIFRIGFIQQNRSEVFNYFCLFKTSSVKMKLQILTVNVTLVNIQQEQKLISSLDIVLAYVWKDFIEPICLRNVTNA